MGRYLIEITLPAADLTYDLFVPDTMQIGMLAQLSARAFSKMAGLSYLPSREPILCDQKSGAILDPNAVVKQTTVRNGTKLLLY